MRIKHLFSLLRVKQWYKNLVIFIPLIFSANLFNTGMLSLSVLGFIALCLISSTNYVINDLVDYPSDKRNPLKKKKPLVSGLVSVGSARLTAVILFISSFILSFSLGGWFWLFPLGLFVSTTSYSLKLKYVPIIDIFIIAFNFFIRTISGGFLINVQITNWLILLIFLVALLLGLSKRYGSLVKLGSKAVSYRRVFKFYTKSLLANYINMISAALILGYCFYTFLSAQSTMLMLSIPIFFFIIFRYLYIVYSGSTASINAEELLKDKQLMIAGLIWILTIGLVLY